MKKIIYLAVAAIFVVSCNNSSKENVSDKDSMQQTDTTAVSDSSNVNTVSDTLKEGDAKAAVPVDATEADKKDDKKDKAKDGEEKAKPSPNAKKIDKDLKWFEHDVKQYVQAVKYGMMGSELSELWQPCVKNEKNLKKYENEMTPEQKAKFKKYQKMLNKR